MLKNAHITRSEVSQFHQKDDDIYFNITYVNMDPFKGFTLNRHNVFFQHLIRFNQTNRNSHAPLNRIAALACYRLLKPKWAVREGRGEGS
jgi:hypothetical protein